MSKSTGVFALALCLAPAVAWADEVHVIVGFHGDADAGVFARHGGKAGGGLSAQNAHAGRVPAAALRALRAEAGVAYVEEDVVRHAGLATVFVPDDTHYAGYQAAPFALMKAPEAWALSKGAGVRVAVLDTGCQLNHPDIGSGTSGKAKTWKNFTSSGGSADVSDKHGHGTHTAGTVGCRTNNATGVAAAGFDCELAIGKVLGNNGSGYSSWIIAGMNWARTDSGSKVISMSLGSSSSSTTEEAAVDAAWNAGLLVVAAAGNDASSTPSYPAAYENALSVAATTADGALASFSNYGSTVDIAAPGVSIASTYKGGGYALMSGTSMATPNVAGVAALVWGAATTATAGDVRTWLDTAGLDVTGTNAGTLKVVNAYAAVLAALEQAPPAEEPPAEEPPAEDPPADPALALSAISPDTLQAGSSTSVTVTGAGFASGATLTFVNGSGGTPTASDVVVVDANTISATVSVGNGGPPRARVWDVVVRNPDGSSATLAGGFTVTR